MYAKLYVVTIICECMYYIGYYCGYYRLQHPMLLWLLQVLRFQTITPKF